MPDVTIVTATYNKPEYLRDAARSVLSQSHADLEWWIILDGPTQQTLYAAAAIAAADPRVRVFHEHTTDDERKAIYRPAAIANRYYPFIATQFIMWLSDDDLLAPRGIQVLRLALLDTGEQVSYGDLRGEHVDARGNKRELPPILAGTVFGPDCGQSPNCRIDGGQVMLTRLAYESLGGWQIPTSWPTAGHSDGLFLQELAKRWKFIPVREHVVTHRRTPLSHWNRTA